MTKEYIVPRGETPRLKIYTQDWGWRGGTLVIAYNEEQARDIMKSEYSYDASLPVEEHEIIHGFQFTQDAS